MNDEPQSNGEVKPDDMAEAIENLKNDIRERREKLSDNIIFAYEEGAPLHKIEQLKDRLRDLDETINRFQN